MNGLPDFPPFPEITASLSVTWGIVAFFIILFALALWKSFAPGWPGISYGAIDIEAIALGRFWVKFRGVNIVDVTHIFNPVHVIQAFRKDVEQELRVVKDQATDADTKTAIATLEGTLKSFSLDNIRLLGIRHRDWQKHLLICLFPTAADATRFPEGFLVRAAKPSLNLLSFEFLNRGVIMGEIFTFPKPWVIPYHSKVRVHLFRPFDQTQPGSQLSAALPVLENVARVAIYARSNVDMKARERTLQRDAAEARRKEHEAHNRTATYATTLDSALSALSAFVTKGDLLKILGRLTGRTATSAIFGVLVSFLAGGFFSQQLGYDPFMGAMVAGIVTALIALLASRR